MNTLTKNKKLNRKKQHTSMNSSTLIVYHISEPFFFCVAPLIFIELKKKKTHLILNRRTHQKSFHFVVCKYYNVILYSKAKTALFTDFNLQNDNGLVVIIRLYSVTTRKALNHSINMPYTKSINYIFH